MTFVLLNASACSDNCTLRIVSSFVIRSIELVIVDLFDLVAHPPHFENVAYLQMVALER